MASAERESLLEDAERRRVTAADTSWALRDVNRAAADVDVALARRLGLRPMDYAAMGHVLDAADPPLSPRDLRQRLGISSGSTTELVDRLENAGHVHRHRDTADRRRVGLRASDASIEQMLAQLRPLMAEVDALAEQFTGDERAAIVRFLREAAQLMRDYRDSAPE